MQQGVLVYERVGLKFSRRLYDLLMKKNRNNASPAAPKKRLAHPYTLETQGNRLGVPGAGGMFLRASCLADPSRPRLGWPWPGPGEKLWDGIYNPPPQGCWLKSTRRVQGRRPSAPLADSDYHHTKIANPHPLAPSWLPASPVARAAGPWHGLRPRHRWHL